MKRSGRQWLRCGGRGLLLIAAPVLFLLLLEGVLVLAGVGVSTRFLMKARPPIGSAYSNIVYRTNPGFGLRFFPSALNRRPEPGLFPTERGGDELRVLVLGGSAALGDPVPDFGLPRMLQAQLEAAYPDRRVRVLNGAMTAVNSHVARVVAAQAEAFEPDAVVVYMGNNEVIGPYGPGTVLSPIVSSPGLIRLHSAFAGTRTGQLLSRVPGALTGDARPVDWGGMEMFLGHRFARGAPELERVRTHFRQNLMGIARSCRSMDAAMLLCTVGTDLRDTAPFASREVGPETPDYSRWTQLQRRADRMAALDRHGAAAQLLTRAWSLIPDHAETAFRIGRHLLAAGRPPEARIWLEEARDTDLLRFRADSMLNSVIRSFAGAGGEGDEQADDGESGTPSAAGAGGPPEEDRARLGSAGPGPVYLVDVERALAAAAPGGIPGHTLFLDHVHFTFDGNFAAARAIAERLRDVLPIVPTGVWPPSREACRERLGYGAHTENHILGEMQDRFLQPPFNTQINQEERLWRVGRRRDELLTHLRAGGYEPVLADMRAVRERYPKDPVPAIWHSYIRVSAGDADGAVESMRDAWELQPFDGETAVDLALMHALAGRLDRCLEWLRRPPPDPTLKPADNLRKVLDSLHKGGHYALSLQVLDRWGETGTDALRIRLAKAEALRALGRKDQAASLYEEALKGRSTLPETLEAATLAFELGRTGRAMEHFRGFLAARPNQPQAHYLYGKALFETGDGASAAAHLETTVELNPSDVDAWLLLARLAFLEGRPRVALTRLKQALHWKPEFDDAVLRLARLQTCLGHPGAGIRALKRAVQEDPAPALQNELAWLLATVPEEALMDGQRAEALARAACEAVDYRHPGYLDTLAAAYAAAGAHDIAVRTQDRVLRRLSDQKGSPVYRAMLQRREAYRRGERWIAKPTPPWRGNRDDGEAPPPE